MRLKGFIFCMALIISAIPCLYCQNYHFEYTQEGREIYRDIIDLKLSLAQEKLELKIREESYNLSYLHLQSYLDFFSIFISEDKSYFDKAQKRKSEYLKIIERKLPDSSPYKKFALAEIQLHSAINRSKFNQILKSAREILNAYNLLKENTRLYPDFIYNKKSLSVIHSLAETVSIPGIVKKLFGINGTIAQGLAEIESVVETSHENDNFLFKEEVDAIFLYILMYQANDQQKAKDYLHRCRLNDQTSLLSTFMMSKIYQKSGLNDAALSSLQVRPRDTSYTLFPYLDLMEGIVMLRKLDPQCVHSLNNFIQTFKGRHFIKEAYQKLAWAKLIFEDDIVGYKHYMYKTKKEGYALVDDDKQALQESETDLIPDADLLRARLLSDGGYYQKAYSLLVQKAYKYLNGEHTLEFNYRMGRICQALKNYHEAIDYFEMTIKKGEHSSKYFACNAALQCGIIYESTNNKLEAKKYFLISLGLNPKEYKNSLHQKAKSGLNRLSHL